MKSAYYAAAATNAYRHALDAVAAGDEVPEHWIRETEKLSHRPYCTGFYYGEPGQETSAARYFSEAEIVAVVEDCDEEGMALVTQRNRFRTGELLELITAQAEPIAFRAGPLFDAEGAELGEARHPMMELRLRLPTPAPRLSILRKSKESS